MFGEDFWSVSEAERETLKTWLEQNRLHYHRTGIHDYCGQWNCAFRAKHDRPKHDRPKRLHEKCSNAGYDEWEDKPSQLTVPWVPPRKVWGAGS